MEIIGSISPKPAVPLPNDSLRLYLDVTVIETDVMRFEPAGNSGPVTPLIAACVPELGTLAGDDRFSAVEGLAPEGKQRAAGEGLVSLYDRTTENSYNCQTPPAAESVRSASRL